MFDRFRKSLFTFLFAYLLCFSCFSMNSGENDFQKTLLAVKNNSIDTVSFHKFSKEETLKMLTALQENESVKSIDFLLLSKNGQQDADMVNALSEMLKNRNPLNYLLIMPECHECFSGDRILDSQNLAKITNAVMNGKGVDFLEFSLWEYTPECYTEFANLIQNTHHLKGFGMLFMNDYYDEKGNNEFYFGTVKMAKALAQSSLNKFQLWGTGTLGEYYESDQVAKEVALSLKVNKGLNEVLLSNFNIDHETSKLWNEMLSNTTTLKSLTLKSDMDRTAFNNILAGLQKNNSLTSVEISDNFSPTRVNFDKIIDYFLVKNLEKFAINSNFKFSTKQIKDISNKLKNNNTLTSLTLWSKSIEDEDAFVLARGLRDNNHLQELKVAAQRCTSDGLRALMSVLEVNHSLTKMTIFDETCRTDCQKDVLTPEELQLFYERLEANKGDNGHPTLQ